MGYISIGKNSSTSEECVDDLGALLGLGLGMNVLLLLFLFSCGCCVNKVECWLNYFWNRVNFFTWWCRCKIVFKIAHAFFVCICGCVWLFVCVSFVVVVVVLYKGKMFLLYGWKKKFF